MTASVLSGNRNFEARVHQSIRANFLMSPPLVVAFALAGRVDIDLASEPLGTGSTGRARSTCATSGRPATKSQSALLASVDPATYRRLYADFAAANPLWTEIPAAGGTVLRLGPGVDLHPGAAVLRGLHAQAAGRSTTIRGARALAIFGDSVTTDHISPAGAIKTNSPAGLYLQAHGVGPRTSTATARAAATTA